MRIDGDMFVSDFAEIKDCLESVYDSLAILNLRVDDFEEEYVKKDETKKIYDVEHFKTLIKQEHFYNADIENFIDWYLKWQNN